MKNPQQYLFGEFVGESISPSLITQIQSQLTSKKIQMAATPLANILSLLHHFGQNWHEDHPWFLEACDGLAETFDLAEIKRTLALIPGLLAKETLTQRLQGEFSDPAVLEGFIQPAGFAGTVKAVPLGTLLHVSAGNVFISCIDTLLMGFLTKNISLLKVSSENLFFPYFFARKLQEFDTQKILSPYFCLLSWRGGKDLASEQAVKNLADGVLAWGGEEMIQNYRQGLPLHAKLLDFGPKISVQVISKKALAEWGVETLAAKVVEDVVAWDQQACASPQNLFLEGSTADPEFLNALETAFARYPLARGKISSDEAVEWLKERYRGLYSAFESEGDLREGKDFMIHVDPRPYLRPSPLNRCLIVKTYAHLADLEAQLNPFHFYLQSCSYALAGVEKNFYLETLARAGMKRFAALGKVMEGKNGGPHDGRYVLRELVHFVVDENDNESSRPTNNVSLNAPLMTAKDLQQIFQDTPHRSGYLFASGGTTGAPKYTHYSHQNFNRVGEMLAYNLAQQGVKKEMCVANLFVAGNLWASFLSVEKALEKLQVLHLPIGGLCPVENILQYLARFCPQVIMGLPSMLVQVALESRERQIPLKIEKLFYAGEALSQQKRQILKDIWQVEYFGSCGYASVDAGVIGYQCLHTPAGVHHLFATDVSLEIIAEEGVVTPHYRTSLPISRYRTGDRMRWVGESTQEQSPCACGSLDPRFELLGRIDGLIQIWSARLQLEDIDRAISQLGLPVLQYQVLITEEDQEKIQLKIEIEKQAINDLVTAKLGQLVQVIYENARDVRDTVSLEFFRSFCELTLLPSQSLPKNPRTGKIPLIVDRRK